MGVCGGGVTLFFIGGARMSRSLGVGGFNALVKGGGRPQQGPYDTNP
jgi:hypothetical protein